MAACAAWPIIQEPHEPRCTSAESRFDRDIYAEFRNVTYRRFRRIAEFLKLDPDWIEREVKTIVRQALDIWPAAMKGLLDSPRATCLLERLNGLRLDEEARL